MERSPLDDRTNDHPSCRCEIEISGYHSANGQCGSYQNNFYLQTFLYNTPFAAQR